jgi:NAD-dependent SIR2 family protein deacetylase
MGWNCARCTNPLVPDEFFSEGKFMVLKCKACGDTKLLEVKKEMLHAPAHQRIFLRNKIVEFYEKLESEKHGKRNNP